MESRSLTNVSAVWLDFDEVSTILQALHIRVLLSRSSGEMKFDSSSSWYVKPGLLRFCGDHVRFFFANYKVCTLAPEVRSQNTKDKINRAYGLIFKLFHPRNFAPH